MAEGILEPSVSFAGWTRGRRSARSSPTSTSRASRFGYLCFLVLFGNFGWGFSVSSFLSIQSLFVLFGSSRFFWGPCGSARHFGGLNFPQICDSLQCFCVIGAGYVLRLRNRIRIPRPFFLVGSLARSDSNSELCSFRVYLCDILVRNLIWLFSNFGYKSFQKFPS